jgi:hypothetical protein
MFAILEKLIIKLDKKITKKLNIALATYDKKEPI